MESETKQTCECKCHFGGAESCPGCKDKHGYDFKCEHCSE